METRPVSALRKNDWVEYEGTFYKVLMVSPGNVKANTIKFQFQTMVGGVWQYEFEANTQVAVYAQNPYHRVKDVD